MIEPFLWRWQFEQLAVDCLPIHRGSENDPGDCCCHSGVDGAAQNLLGEVLFGGGWFAGKCAKTVLTASSVTIRFWMRLSRGSWSRQSGSSHAARAISVLLHELGASRGALQSLGPQDDALGRGTACRIATYLGGTRHDRFDRLLLLLLLLLHRRLSSPIFRSLGVLDLVSTHAGGGGPEPGGYF